MAKKNTNTAAQAAANAKAEAAKQNRAARAAKAEAKGKAATAKAASKAKTVKVEPTTERDAFGAKPGTQAYRINALIMDNSTAGCNAAELAKMADCTESRVRNHLLYLIRNEYITFS